MTATIEAALAHHRAGRLAEADAIYREILAQRPRDVDAANLSGRVAQALGRHAEALVLFQLARDIEPAFADAHQNEGNAFRALGQPIEAIAAFDRALALAPENPMILCNRGLAALDIGDFAGAIDRLERAATLAPSIPAIRHNLAVAYKFAGRPQAALAIFTSIGASDDAATLRADLFDHAGARAEFAAAGGKISANRLFVANYDPKIDETSLRALYAQWGAQFQSVTRRPHTRRSPAKRLAVGFMSPDLREHSMSAFLWALLEHFPRGDATLVAYANHPGADDAWTARYRTVFHKWRRTTREDDDTLARLIEEDGIDVLIDLAGHTVGNRLAVFARKPAPVQATWLGYGGTTGLAAIDWFIGDERLVPPGGEASFVERVWRLPHTAFAYAPPEGMPEVRPLPACARGHVTFGCFSRSIRLNEPTLRAWAGILARLPSARLALNTRVFEEDATRTLFARRFAEYGGDPARVDLSHTKPQSVTWAAYGDVDVALDPFPHNAGATTFEALWMGVPVVSKRDRIPLGRFGASILGACGLDDWVVDDVDAYVNRAVAAVSDLGELSKLRAGLRMRMANSPLCDHAAFAGDFAEALRSMWAAYCSSN